MLTNGVSQLPDAEGFLPDDLIAVSREGRWRKLSASRFAAAVDPYTDPRSRGAKGDGVTDDGAILQAILDEGRGLYLPAGCTFLLGATTLVPPSGALIHGSGILRRVQTAGGQAFIRIMDVSDVTVEGIGFFDPRVSGSRSYGVTIENSTDIAVRHCRFLGYETAVFVWKNTNRYEVSDNLMRGGDFGVATGGDALNGSANGPVKNGEIARNVIVGTTSEGIDVNWDTQRCLIESNRVIGCNTVAHEEDLDIGGGVCRDITVRGNTFDSLGNSARCINLKLDTQRVTIEGNTFRGMTSDAIGTPNDVGPLAYVTITGNTMDGGGVATGRGIALRRCDGFRIINNTVTAFLDDGITTFGTSGNGVIQGNDVTLCDDGIVCLSARTTINANTSRANSRHGCNVQAPNVTITGNVLTSNSQNVGSGSFGLVLSAGSDGAVITGNRCTDDQPTKTQSGLIIVGTSDRCIVTSNYLAGNKNANNANNLAGLTNSQIANNITA